MFQRLYTVFASLFMAVAAFGQTDSEHVRLTNLPHVYINTFSGASITSKDTYVYARMWYVDEDDVVTFYDSLQIRGRGNSTWNLPKKPYKLKFNEKVKLLGKGRPNTKKWTLMANAGDKTLLRNALTSLMGERAGLKFNPAAKFVDLTLNGRYVGNYQFSDQIDVRPHRVNIAEQDVPLSSSSDISGGYLMEADGFRDFTTGWSWYGQEQATGFYTNQGVPVRIHYPDEDDIVDSQVNYISNHVQEFENRLFGNDFTDPVEGYRPLVDSLSLVRWYLCTELSGNVDGFFSAYFYKDSNDDHIFFGPLWDYDIAYNNDNRSREGTNNTLQQLMVEAGYGSGWGNGNRDWLTRMWDDPWFARLVNREFNALVSGGLEQYLNAKLDSLVALIDQSQQLNYERWGIRTQVLRERVLYSSYDRYVADLRTYITGHTQYLATAFASRLPDTPEPGPTPGPDAKVPDFTVDKSYYYTIRNLGSSTRLDIDAYSDLVVGNAVDNSSETQQWRLYNLSNGYIFIRNRATGQALCDDSPAGTTATSNTGTQLSLVRPDSTDTRQQWDLVSQGDGRYNLISRWSQHAANLSGGNSADGTPVLSYTSDDRNSSSNNRLWYVETAGRADLVPTGIVSAGEDYALAFDPSARRLHFGAEDRSALTFMAYVYDQAGHRLRSFRADTDLYLNDLPDGLYIVAWSRDGRRNAVKLLLR